MSFHQLNELDFRNWVIRVIRLYSFRCKKIELDYMKDMDVKQKSRVKWAFEGD